MRLKPYKVVAHLMHESFNGYDHHDESKTFVVQAQNLKSAETKARKEFRKFAPQWVRSFEIRNENNESDFMLG